MAAPNTTPFTDYGQELAYIKQRASQWGLDPGAVLAVAASEGVTLPSAPGDNNSSFGPWQLHVGGKLPANIAQQGPTYAQGWANSPAGIDYALEGIARVARGLTGFAAIRMIVTNFEQPKDPNSETLNAYKRYQSGTVPAPASGKSSGSSSGGFWNDIKSGVGAAATGNPIGGAVGAAEAAGSLVGLSPKDIPGVAQYDALTGFFGKITDPAFLLRAGEVVGGAVLILLGGYLLARQIGLAAAPSNRVASAAVGAVT